MNFTIVAIIQARMGSTRLPGKVLKDLAGLPLLARVVRRTGRASRLDEIVVAIPEASTDDTLASFCHANGWRCFRGSEGDVLDRYYRAATEYNAENVVRITSDCPLVDAGIIDQLVDLFLQGQWDYVSNTLSPRTYPRGLDVEVFTFDALRLAWKEDSNATWREHVTPYIYRNPARFHLQGLKSATDYSHMRWTVDAPEDLRFVRKIYGHFGHDNFEWRDVLALLEEHPEWLEINRYVSQRIVE